MWHGRHSACLWTPVKARGGLPRSLLEKELESVGIRLNKHKPNIYFKVRPSHLEARTGGLAMIAAAPL